MTTNTNTDTSAISFGFAYFPDITPDYAWSPEGQDFFYRPDFI